MKRLRGLNKGIWIWMRLGGGRKRGKRDGGYGSGGLSEARESKQGPNRGVCVVPRRRMGKTLWRAGGVEGGRRQSFGISFVSGSVLLFSFSWGGALRVCGERLCTIFLLFFLSSCLWSVVPVQVWLCVVSVDCLYGYYFSSSVSVSSLVFCAFFLLSI